MSVFFGSTTCLRAYTVKEKLGDFTEKLDLAAFKAQPESQGPDGKRLGFVGLSDPLDTDFNFDPREEQYLALALRIDERKPQAAKIRLKLAEAIKAEMDEKGSVSRQRKKELKEKITAEVAAKTEPIPNLVDIVYDTARERFLLTSTAEAVNKVTLELVNRVFELNPEPLLPVSDLSSLFQRIFVGEEEISVQLSDSRRAVVESDDYIVTLATDKDAAEQATVTSRGSQEPGLKALEQGLEIRKLGLLAKIYEDGQTEEDEAVVCRFQLDDTLAITGLKMPKGEKGGDKAGDFILKADHAFLVVELVEKLFSKKDD